MANRKKAADWIPISILLIIGGAIWLWAFNRLLYTFLSETLEVYGISGTYMPNLMIVIIIGVLLILGGKKAKTFIK